MQEDDKRLMEALRTKTIDDVARELGISKTTVSRSISGKGRISASTRRKVLDYIEETNYKPNPQAKGLAQSRCYNIGWVVPGDAQMVSLSFFQRCMQGVIDVAAQQDCDVIITTVNGSNISGLKRVLENRKADGIVLGQTLTDDAAIRYMKEQGIPFVVVGSAYDSEVVQVDNDHIAACRELAAIIKMKGVRFVSYIGGDSRQVVNETRRMGFEAGISPVKHSVYTDCVSPGDIEQAVEAAVIDGAECIICGDDRICYYAMAKLMKDGIRIPEKIRLASFYSSSLLEGFQPAITALRYDPRELGEKACHILMDMIEGRKVPKKTLLGYEVLLKASTQ